MTIRRFKKNYANAVALCQHPSFIREYDRAMEDGADLQYDLSHSGFVNCEKRAKQALKRCTAAIQVLRAEARRRRDKVLMDYTKVYRPVRTLLPDVPF